MSTKKLTKREQKALKSKIKVPKPNQAKKVQIHWMPLLAILAITAIVFYPSLHNEFVNWDDDRNFYENILITSLNSENFWSNTSQIFSTTVIGNYNPLTIWTFLIEQKIFGLDQPFYWHLDNLILHMICIYFVYRISLLMGLKWQGAALVSLLFAIHPLRVESVAWVTERKDVLFASFYLAAIFLYLKNKLIQAKPRYLIAIIILFVLSLFSKIQAVALPLSFICIDYYFDQEFGIKTIISKWYYFMISILFGLMGIYFLSDQGSLESNVTYELWQRIFVGSYSYMIYLIKAVVPFRMSPLYPYPNTMPSYFYPSILVFLLGPFVLWKAYKKELKAIVFGILFFTVNIVFLLQILGAGQGFIADRFTYIPYLGLFFIFGYYLDRFLQKENNISFKKKTQLFYSGIVCIGLIYGFMSFQQCKIWQNSGTLWTHVLKYYSNITLPYGNRANYYRDSGQLDKALADYNSCINLKPIEAGPYNSRARLYFNTKNNVDTLQLALADYNKAIELKDNDGEYYINRGAVHARLNNPQAALQDINKGLELKPDHVSGYINRFVLNSQLGNLEEALRDIQTHLKYVPYAADSWYESGRLKFMLGKGNEAVPDYTRAIELNPKKALFYYERSKILFNLGRIQEAQKDFNMAKSMNYPVDQNYAIKLFDAQ